MKGLFATVCFILIGSTVAYASGGGDAHGGEQVINFGWRLLNFVVLVLIFYKLSAKAVKKFFVSDREHVIVSLQEAEQEKEDALRKLNECSARLEKAAAEIDDLRDMITARGQEEKEKIIEDAKRTAEKMKEDARSRMEQELSKAVNQLRAAAAGLSVETAEDIIKKNIRDTDHENMVQKFLERVGSRN
jgi:F-type H+-transporting ATPase subunit b